MSEQVITDKAILREKGDPLQPYRKIFHFVDNLNEKMGKIAGLFIVVLVALTVVNVVFRYFLRIFFLEDIVDAFVKVLVIYLIMGAPYTFQTGAQVTNDIALLNASPRKRAILRIAFFPLIILLLVVTIIVLLRYGLGTYLTLRALIWNPSEITFFDYLDPSLWPIDFIWPIGIFLLLVQQSVKFARDLIFVLTGGEEV